MTTDALKPEKRGFRAPGTTFMVAGGMAGAIGAYLFHAYGGRTLGEAAFEPIALLWTLFFILATVLLVPVEQYVTREVSSGHRAIPGHLKPTLVMAGIGSIVGAAYIYLNLEERFNGEWQYIAQVALLMAGHSLLLLGKGVLAGGRHFASVGWVLIVESAVRLVAGILALALAASAVSLGWAMVLGGFAALGLRWWRRDTGGLDGHGKSSPRFLGGYVAGTASSQVLLGSAPIAVAALAGAPAEVSIIFVTFTIFRAPLTLIFALQGRILPYLVGIAGDGDSAKLARIARRFLFGGAALAALGGLAGYAIGDDVVRILFGPEFAPSQTIAMLAAAGVMAAAAAQLTSQVLVAEGKTRTLSIAWLGGLAAAVLVLPLFGGDPGTRVALAFVVGEFVALGLMGVLSTRRSSARG